MSEPQDGRQPLDALQRWFQTVITHASGVEEGIRARDAQEVIQTTPSEVEKVIRRSSRLAAIERLSIYANAYYARLLECLGGCFPVLKQAMGDEVFHGFAFEYLQHYPSHSYTLDHLGEHFSRYLQETRPDPQEDETGWPDFLIDLATLEWAIDKIFDSPGCEGQPMLTPEKLLAFPAERFAEARLSPVPGFQLLTFRYPVSAYYGAVRHAAEGETVPIPAPGTERIAVFRRDFVVRRYSLHEAQHALLQKIVDGATVGESISAATAKMDVDDDSLAGVLQNWFRVWSAEGFFAAVTW